MDLTSWAGLCGKSDQPELFFGFRIGGCELIMNRGNTDLIRFDQTAFNTEL
jgi:hypothetical protein